MPTQKLRRLTEILREDGPRTAFQSTSNFIISRADNQWNRIKNRIKYGKSYPNPYKLINIDPNDVDWLIVPRYIKPDKYKTYIHAGDWDQTYSDEVVHYKGTSEGYDDRSSPKLINFENFTFYTSLESHFRDNVPWEETKIYDELMSSDISSRYTGGDEIKARLGELDVLYNQIDENGYMSQRQLQRENNSAFSVIEKNPPEKEEVLVNIGRDGEIIFCTGRHRFCVARILGIDQIPSRVHVRHDRWQKYRHDVYNKSSKYRYTNKNSIDHPDMGDLI